MATRQRTRPPPLSALPSSSSNEEGTSPANQCPLCTTLQLQVEMLAERIQHVEQLAHTDHTLSTEVLEHITTQSVIKMVAHFSTLLRMGDTLLSSSSSSSSSSK